MPVKFSMTSKASVGSGVKVLVYGQGGMGKTMLTATLPRPLLISAEAGLLSLTSHNIARTFGTNTPGICYDIPVATIGNLQDLGEVYSAFATGAAWTKDVDSIALDSVSEIAEICLSSAKVALKDNRQAYGDMNEKMTLILRQFRDLPDKNVYFSAKMERDKDDASGLILYQPSLPGKNLSNNLPYFFDEVFALCISQPDTVTKKTFRYLLTKPNVQYTAKDRSGALNEFEQPNLLTIINKIRNV